MTDHGCNKRAIFRIRDTGVGLKGLTKYNREVRTLEKRYLKR